MVVVAALLVGLLIWDLFMRDIVYFFRKSKEKIIVNKKEI